MLCKQFCKILLKKANKILFVTYFIYKHIAYIGNIGSANQCLPRIFQSMSSQIVGAQVGLLSITILSLSSCDECSYCRSQMVSM